MEAVDPVKDINVKEKIILLLVQENFYYVRAVSTAREVWQKLAKAFEGTGLTREVGLLYKLIGTDLESCGSIEGYAE